MVGHLDLVAKFVFMILTAEETHRIHSGLNDTIRTEVILNTYRATFPPAMLLQSLKNVDVAGLKVELQKALFAPYIHNAGETQRPEIYCHHAVAL